MSELTHLNEKGEAHMVDVSAKEVTTRTAIATAFVCITPEVLAKLDSAGLPKGDALATARIAGIAGAKRTADLIPLCHPIAIHSVEVDLSVHSDGVEIRSTVRTADRTGIEMEALTSVSVAALTLIDMVKGVDRMAYIRDIKLLEKHGGRSGAWVRSE